mgnify:CR=1 FL=1
MSTPKPNMGAKKLWEHNFLSPIVTDAHEQMSDSDFSDEYKSVKSNLSSKVSYKNHHLVNKTNMVC